MVRHIDGNPIVYKGKGMDFDAIAQKDNLLIDPPLRFFSREEPDHRSCHCRPDQ